jgi:hypothetical protein
MGMSGEIATEPSTRTGNKYDAGTHECNYSMYMLSELAPRGGCIYGFLHIPEDFSQSIASEYISAEIDRILSIAQVQAPPPHALPHPAASPL